jgi:hypothetical protein
MNTIALIKYSQPTSSIILPSMVNTQTNGDVVVGPKSKNARIGLVSLYHVILHEGTLIN